VAIDATGPGGRFKAAERPRLGKLMRSVRRVLTGSEASIPRLGETIIRTVTVGSTDTVTNARLHADVVITPAVAGVGLLDWKALRHVRELGRTAGRGALAAEPDLIERLACGLPPGVDSAVG
jgi:hypothetical protein